MDRAGLVGVGRMGRAMLKHLIAKKGFEVVVCDINPDNCRQAEAMGATVAPTPKALAETTDVHFICVGFDPEVEQVSYAEDGLLAGAKPGNVIVVNSTADPELVKTLGQRAAEKNVQVVDCPIARGGPAADDGTLLALVGGDKKAVAKVRPMLETFCSDIAVLGGLGHGQVGKAMNNLLLWVNGVALIEAGRLAEQQGLDLVQLREVLMMSSGQSWALENWNGVTFTWALKDMQIVMDMCDRANASFPMMGFIKEQVKDAKEERRANRVRWTRS